MTIALSFGIVLQPHIMIRYYSAASGRVLKWLGATTPIFLVTLYLPAALVGLGGAVILPDLAIADRIFPELLVLYAPDLAIADRIFPELLVLYAPAWLTGLILAGATAAAMSTLDSILHANMTVLTRDVYQRYLAPDRSAAHYLWVGRAIVLVLLVVGYVLSVYTFGFLVTLVTLSGAGALQLLPGTLGVCYPTRRPFTRAGVLTGIAGGLAVLYWTLVVVPHPWGIHGALWSLAMNFAVCIVVSRLSPTPSRETVNRIHGALEDYVYGAGEEVLEPSPAP